MKNVIFDLGGVILKDSPISILNNVDDYEILKKFFDDWTLLDLGKISLEEKFLSCNFSNEIILKYKSLLLEYYKYRKINMDFIYLISILKNNGYNVYILSDNNMEAYNYYKNNDLFKNIDGWVLSCEYGCLKKDGVLFEILIDKFNLKSDECYFIDDRKINIDMALKYGIKGFVFGDVDCLISDMKKCGFKF